jgi:hypothetical protein
MAELVSQAPFIALLFALIFVLNLVPAFAPPTWMTLSFVGLTIPTVPRGLLALVGATAATLGRTTLAKLSRQIVRARLLDETTRTNVDAIKMGLERHRSLTFGIFLVYAFSPLPSNYLFIAYGLTSLRLAFVALPFFIGRFISYGLWVNTASAIGDWLDLDSVESAFYVGIYFVISQLLLVPAMYVFTRIDWRAAFKERTFRWVKRG